MAGVLQESFREKPVIHLPHEDVFTRLKPSKIHGVGVFAILPISKGQYIFEPDDDSLALVSQDALSDIPEAFTELYRDFCPQDGKMFQCPVSFNRLTPSWYLNHSAQPNVAPDSDLRFYALRDIARGEELTSDYSTYTNPEDQRGWMA